MKCLITAAFTTFLYAWADACTMVSPSTYIAADHHPVAAKMVAEVVMEGGLVAVSRYGNGLLHQLWEECDITAIKVVADGIRVSHIRLTSAAEHPRA